MNISDFNFLTEDKKGFFVDESHLLNKKDRTLLYGYDLKRNTWHTYIKDGVINTVVYGFDEKIYEMFIEGNSDYIPDKRLYPEACDFEFSILLKRNDIHLPFTSYVEREEKVFYGKIL